MGGDPSIAKINEIADSIEALDREALANDYHPRRRALRLARIELLNSSARFGALANRRVRAEQAIHDQAAEAVTHASRAFVRAEQAFADAESAIGIVHIHGARS